MTLPHTPGICLVGCGWWGAVHALALKRQGHRIRRFYASRNPEHARDFARRFEGSAFDLVDDTFGNPAVDAVVVALPHDVQAHVAERALRAGKHVLIEKPIALDVEAAERLIRAAEESGRFLAVAEEYRLSPLVQAAHALIQQGILGRVCWAQITAAGTNRPAQEWKQRRARGILMDVGVHYVDILRLWFGEPDLAWATYPPKVNDGLAGEDGVVAVLRFGDGPVATIALSWSAHRSREAPHVEVTGELGSLDLRFDRPYLLHHTPLAHSHWSHRVTRRLPWRLVTRISRWLPKDRQRRIHVANKDLIGSEAMIADFVEAIALGRAPAVPGEEGLRDLRVVLAAYAAAEGGAPAKVAR